MFAAANEGAATARQQAVGPFEIGHLQAKIVAVEYSALQELRRAGGIAK